MSCQGFQSLQVGKSVRVRIKTLEVPGQPTGDEYLYAVFTSNEEDSEEEPST